MERQFELGLRPVVSSFNIILEVLKQEDNLSVYLGYLDRMIQDEYVPEIKDLEFAAVSIAITNPFNAITFSQYQYYQLMLQKLSNVFKPTDIIYQSNLLSAIKHKDLSLIDSILTEMSDNKLNPRLHMYNRLMQSYLLFCREELISVEEAQNRIFKWYEEMVASNYQPTSQTYSILIFSHALTGNLDAMSSILTQLIVNKIAPTRQALSAIQIAQQLIENQTRALLFNHYLQSNNIDMNNPNLSKEHQQSCTELIRLLNNNPDKANNRIPLKYPLLSTYSHSESLVHYCNDSTLAQYISNEGKQGLTNLCNYFEQLYFNYEHAIRESQLSIIPTVLLFTLKRSDVSYKSFKSGNCIGLTHTLVEEWISPYTSSDCQLVYRGNLCYVQIGKADQANNIIKNLNNTRKIVDNETYILTIEKSEYDIWNNIYKAAKSQQISIVNNERSYYFPLKIHYKPLVKGNNQNLTDEDIETLIANSNNDKLSVSIIQTFHSPITRFHYVYIRSNTNNPDIINSLNQYAVVFNGYQVFIQLLNECATFSSMRTEMNRTSLRVQLEQLTAQSVAVINEVLSRCVFFSSDCAFISELGIKKAIKGLDSDAENHIKCIHFNTTPAILNFNNNSYNNDSNNNTNSSSAANINKGNKGINNTKWGYVEFDNKDWITKIGVHPRKSLRSDQLSIYLQTFSTTRTNDPTHAVIDNGNNIIYIHMKCNDDNILLHPGTITGHLKRYCCIISITIRKNEALIAIPNDKSALSWYRISQYNNQRLTVNPAQQNNIATVIFKVQPNHNFECIGTNNTAKHEKTLALAEITTVTIRVSGRVLSQQELLDIFGNDYKKEIISILQYVPETRNNNNNNGANHDWDDKLPHNLARVQFSSAKIAQQFINHWNCTYLNLRFITVVHDVKAQKLVNIQAKPFVIYIHSQGTKLTHSYLIPVLNKYDITTENIQVIRSHLAIVALHSQEQLESFISNFNNTYANLMVAITAEMQAKYSNNKLDAQQINNITNTPTARKLGPAIITPIEFQNPLVSTTTKQVAI
jgi:hypothetical protein